MSETFFVADSHIDHANVIIHCDRGFQGRKYLQPGDLDRRGTWISEEIKQKRCAEMNADIVSVWNATIGKDDLVYIIGDFAWKNHRRWINILNGKKVMIIGSHDKMPTDVLDLFKPDWFTTPGIPVRNPDLSTAQEFMEQAKERLSLLEAVKTLVNFREVHWLLNREVCGQYLCMCHWPMRTWQGRYHNSWCITGHTHGRMKETLPGETSGGLILDIGWDVWGRPVHFEEVRSEMKRKLHMMKGRVYTAGEVEN